MSPESDDRGDEVERFALLSTWRWLPWAAVVAGVLSALALVGTPRWVCLGGTAFVLLAAAAARLARPVLVVDARGYRVEERGRVRLTVGFTEIARARAVPAEQAMYLDCGEPARNLLVPPRRGYGFRFERQGVLYARLARALGDRLEVVSSLERPAGG
jgi:hypothetical protein